MMNRTTKWLTAAAFILLPMVSEAQTGNPRGIYKMITLTGKQGEIKAPFDQYKICTDSITLMVSMQGKQFAFSNTDNRVFNYTGEEPDANDSTSTRIFNSDADHFTLKWWNTTPNHFYFPQNDWCTEYYEAGQYSEHAKVLFDALTSPTASDPQNPFVGTWRIVGMMDELRDTKQQLKKLRSNDRYTANSGNVIITPSYIVMYSNGRRGGSINRFTCMGKKKVMIGNTIAISNLRGSNEHAITWLDKDCFAMEVQLDGYRTDYEIWERVTDSSPLLNQIVSQFVPRR